jgi:hypothetical protein
MRYLLLFFLSCLLASATAQTVNDTPIAELDAPYILIVGTSRPFSNKVTITVDFGQHSAFFSAGQERVIKDADGKVVTFNSMIDALNFFFYLDYEFAQAYTVTMGNQNVYHYLMRKVYYIDD